MDKLLADSYHRDSAYSAYPAEAGVSEKAASGMINAPAAQTPEMGMGHSIRFGNYPYMEWRARPDQAATAAVLTGLDSDPGETTNVMDHPEHSDALKQARRLLDQRINAAVQDATAPN